MTFTIAVAGKGGVGKTSVSALIVKYLTSEKGGVVLAVDADPNSNLHEKLGVVEQKSLGSLREETARTLDSLPAGISKAEHIGYLLRTIIFEGKKFDLLTMGRSEGPGCYCYLNSLLRGFIDTLSEKYPYVVIDNEAGMEHLSRRTTRNVDVLLLVSDGTPTGMGTVKRLAALAGEMDLKIKKTVLVVNRAGSPGAAKHGEGGTPSGFASFFTLPDDAKLNAYNSECKSLLELPGDSEAYKALREMMEGLMK
jgi:CO dehydrogenase maturation factor